MKEFSKELIAEVLRMTYENEWAPMIISKVIRRSFGVELRADDVRDILEKEKHGNGYTD